MWRPMSHTTSQGINPKLDQESAACYFGRASVQPLASDAPHAPVKPPMILKGNQRGSGQQLATQLLNADNNQRVEILDLRSSIARALHGGATQVENLDALIVV